LDQQNSDAPWYAAGLAFSCRRCGDCCRGPGGYVWVTEAEAGDLSAALGLSLAAFAAKMLRNTPSGLALIDSAGGDCVLLGPDGRCRVYANRPRQCRTWPWWAENLSSSRRWNDLAARCPGMNQGARHSRPDIEKALARDI
jgi:Fe-S-cluster containining protein